MKRKIILITLLFLLAYPVISEDAATFDFFYSKTLAIGVWGWVLAGVVAVVAGAAIFLSGGTASPIVVGIGTFIGNMAGLTGAAATSYGLALLGGGAVATGGLGVIGGAALLTAALTFSTEVVVDYAVTAGVNTYDSAKFYEASKQMLSFPVPRNDKGSKTYKEAFALLEDMTAEESYHAPHNAEILKKAILLIEKSKEDYKSLEYIQIESLKALLYFAVCDYAKAKAAADQSIRLASHEDVRRTLPAVIFATSALYEERPYVEKLTMDYFRYGIMAEPDNKLIPLAFATYADRLFYRFQDGSVVPKDIHLLVTVATEPDMLKQEPEVLMILLSRIMMQIKLEQQIILTLTSVKNDTIRNSPLTLDRAKRALSNYESLLVICDDIFKHFFEISCDQDSELASEVGKVYSTHARYKVDIQNLASAISDLSNVMAEQRLQSFMNLMGQIEQERIEYQTSVKLTAKDGDSLHRVQISRDKYEELLANAEQQFARYLRSATKIEGRMLEQTVDAFEQLMQYKKYAAEYRLSMNLVNPERLELSQSELLEYKELPSKRSKMGWAYLLLFALLIAGGISMLVRGRVGSDSSDQDVVASKDEPADSGKPDV